MSQITLTIDGKICNGSAGQTILEVARTNDIYIPTLCYLEGLSPIGACRMCVVEVEGNAKLLTSCTTPANDGMVVHTATDKLKAYRKEILELMFAGRNHFCMFCSQSGDCELQRLAIEHGMDSVRYPFLYAPFHNDTSKETIQMDHNRCILCLRCIRVCAEKVGAHTLDLEKRGWNTNVVADLGHLLGQSESCVDCGACAQVCPTGAITIRDFVYRGRRNDCDDVVESVCPLCSMGCKIKAYVRTGSVTRVEGTETSSPDGGQLCFKGRWELPKSTERDRVAVPMIREGSSFREASWDEALDLVATKMKGASKDKMGVLVSDLSSNEDLSSYAALFRYGLKLGKYDVFNGDVSRGFLKGMEPVAMQKVRPFTAAHNILESDVIMTVGADPQEEAPVVASYVRVGAIKNGASVINVSGDGAPFPGVTDSDLRVDESDMESFLGGLCAMVADVKSGKDIDTSELAERFDLEAASVCEAVKLLAGAKKPVFVVGRKAAKFPKAVTAVTNVAIVSGGTFDDGLAVVPLMTSGNSLGTLHSMLGQESWLGEGDLDVLFVSSTGLVDEDPDTLDAMTKSRFTVVHTPFMVHPLVNMADVILPAQAWFEVGGHYCSLEGENRKAEVIVKPDDERLGVDEVVSGLADRLGVTLDRSCSVGPCESVFLSEVAPDRAKTVEL
ncbi:ferredoxin [Dethiosulfovibrio peptidovorans DSM 11002]|uniref:Ferredoxin n=1 Tax=Dethiosulfovibrio peptidovorans DSM 11002 TaxID=469381 RepID=D2Z2N3_9BACT|nr:molybdopterin-dependent oxidoreductase [Dethiosulfovibrio peptidovorans]EFC92046.1 ferredoxin [Dethiosulfovibrio peptidovorans DSM 11002]